MRCCISEKKLNRLIEKYSTGPYVYDGEKLFRHLWRYYRWEKTIEGNDDVICLASYELSEIEPVNVPGIGRMGFYLVYDENEKHSEAILLEDASCF